MAIRRPNYNQIIKALIRDVALKMPEFSHVKASRILVVAGEARRGSRGTVKPLAAEPGKPVIRFKGRRMLYCITLRPLFFRDSSAQDRIGTLLHELFHIASQFDGTLHGGRRHTALGIEFSKKLRPLVREYLRLCSKEIKDAFAYDGEVHMLQWLERPGPRVVEGKVRKVYTEEQLFLGPIRMVTPRVQALH